jgi:peptide deformylase
MGISRVIDKKTRNLFKAESKDRMDEIRIYPDPILMKVSAPIANINGKIKELIDHMARVMHVNKGIGLAAPQIGILSQIIVVNFGEGLRALINPEIIEGEGESVLEEGCLSIPTIEVPVKRKEKVFIRTFDINGKEVSLELSGFPGRVYQHEVDHLHGILIIHHISRLKRELLIKRMFKDLKRSKSKGSVL